MQNFQLAYNGLDTLTNLDNLFTPDREFYYKQLVDQRRKEQMDVAAQQNRTKQGR